MTGYTIKEAAAKLGISQGSVRNWIKAGKLNADRVQGDRGKEWRIWLDVDQPKPSTGADDKVAVQPVETALAPLDALRDAISTSTAPLSEDVRALTAAIDALREELAKPRPRPWWRFGR